MKTWMKKLDESLNNFVPIPDDSYDDEVQVVTKESKRLLRTIARNCKEEGIALFYTEHDGMIVVDDIDNLVK